MPYIMTKDIYFVLNFINLKVLKGVIEGHIWIWVDLLETFSFNMNWWEKSRWQIADGPWDLDLHNFKQLLQIFATARVG
jgi:hypothetical protein